MMEGLQRWIIETGPAQLRAGEGVKFGASMELVDGTGILTRQLLFVRVYEVQTLAGTESKVTFQSGRLFKNGDIMTVWGVYDSVTMRGELWLLSVPRPYTGYYHGRNQI